MTTVAPVVSTGRRGRVALALGPVAIALATGVILAEAVDVLAVNHGLASSLRSGWTQLVAPAFIVLVLLALVCERIWPAERRPLLARGHLQDAGYFLLYILAIAPFMTLLSVGSAVVLGSHARWLEAPWTASWPRCGRRRHDAAGHGSVQLDRPSGRSPHRCLLAGACLASLAGGAQCPHLVPSSPADAHERLLAGHRARAGADRGSSARPRAHHRLRLSRHPPPHQRELVLRSAGVGTGQSGLSPAPPFGGQSGCQSRRRAHRVGPPGPDRPASPAGESPCATGLAGRPVPVEQAGARSGAAGLMARQLMEPFSPN